jgi:hypothetical protein
MSDLDLHEALSKVADQAADVDLLARVSRGAARRRRRRTAVSVMAVSVVVTGVVTAAATTIRSHDQAAPSHPDPTTTSKHQLPLRDRLPRYLPPGVRLISSGSGRTRPLLAAAFHAVYAANHARIRFDIIDDRRLPRCSTVGGERFKRPRVGPCSDDGWSYAFSPLAPGHPQVINGRTAHVAGPSEATHGFGIQDIEWREGAYHYVLASERLNLKSGPSGIPLGQLVRMARSVPRDPSVPADSPLPNPPDVTIPSSVLNGYHRFQRQLLNADGATISFSRTRLGEFELLLQPLDGIDHASGRLRTNDLGNALRRATHVVHLSIDGVRAIGWTGPADYAGLRYRQDGFEIGFLGRSGVTIADFKRIAIAMKILPHNP